MTVNIVLSYEFLYSPFCMIDAAASVLLAAILAWIAAVFARAQATIGVRTIPDHRVAGTSV